MELIYDSIDVPMVPAPRAADLAGRRSTQPSLNAREHLRGSDDMKAPGMHKATSSVPGDTNAPSAAEIESQHEAQELFPVVTPSGLVIGRCLRSYAHNGSSMVLHPVVHLHIINREGSIYLQHRSMSKRLLPGRWDTAVGGHVSFGESIREALYREAQEELGLSDFNPIYLDTYVYESKVERELVNVWAIVGSSYDIHPDGQEVSEGRFWTPDEIDGARGHGILTPNFESEYDRISTTLQALL